LVIHPAHPEQWFGGIEMAKTSPFKFLQEVRTETEKVTWPSRRETAITTAMVFVMVAVASIFFLIADQIIRMIVTFVLGVGG
jgi:preprotein translocase subunit SecE